VGGVVGVKRAKKPENRRAISVGTTPDIGGGEKSFRGEKESSRPLKGGKRILSLKKGCKAGRIARQKESIADDNRRGKCVRLGDLWWDKKGLEASRTLDGRGGGKHESGPTGPSMQEKKIEMNGSTFQEGGGDEDTLSGIGNWGSI